MKENCRHEHDPDWRGVQKHPRDGRFGMNDGIKIETESRLRRSEDDMMDFHEEIKLLKKEIFEEMQRGLSQNR